MSVDRLILTAEECRRRLTDFQSRCPCPNIRTSILRVEGPRADIHRPDLWAPLFAEQPGVEYQTWTTSEGFALRFGVASQIELIDAFLDDRRPFSDSDFGEGPYRGLQRGIEQSRQHIEGITGEFVGRLSRNGENGLEALRLPSCQDWWRLVFHLAWHFDRPFLRARRIRFLVDPQWGRTESHESFIQLYGTAGRADLFPGMIYSCFGHGWVETSIAAFDLILERLRAARGKPILTPKLGNELSPEVIATFRQLHEEFRATAEHFNRMPLPGDPQITRLLKLTSSFSSPPAIDWADLRPGGAPSACIRLAVLNAQQELLYLRGPWTQAIRDQAARAGRALSDAAFPDRQILFQVDGFGSGDPVTDRDDEARWIGFVFATIRDLRRELLDIHWMTGGQSVGYGYADLKCDFFTASALAIEVSGLLHEPDQQEEIQDGPVTEDCRSFRLHGVVETFTKNQAAVIKAYWDSRQAGAPELACDTALVAADVNSTKLRDVFKIRGGKMHPAWDRLFRPGSKKGTYILNVRT